MKHFQKNWLPWLEKRLPPDEQQAVAQHLAACQACGAEAAETRDLVDALAAMPSALQALPWRQERLWPAIRAGLQSRPAAYRAWSWATWASLALLLAMFCGVWWGGTFNTSASASGEASYIAQPPTAATVEPAATIRPHLTPISAASPSLEGGAPMFGTPQPVPAPAQTPLFSGTIFTGTVAPRS